MIRASCLSVVLASAFTAGPALAQEMQATMMGLSSHETCPSDQGFASVIQISADAVPVSILVPPSLDEEPDDVAENEAPAPAPETAQATPTAPVVRVRRGGQEVTTSGFGFKSVSVEDEPEADPVEDTNDEPVADPPAQRNVVTPPEPTEELVAAKLVISAVLCQDQQTALISAGEWALQSVDPKAKFIFGGPMPSGDLQVPEITYRTDGRILATLRLTRKGAFLADRPAPQTLTLDITSELRWGGSQ